MNLLHSLLVVVGVTAATVTAMLLVRRRAPAGSFFSDGDRASGVFGVLATGFSVLLGFIIFLAFQAYDDTRAGAETEAAVVAQMVQTAQLMPAGSSQELTGEQQARNDRVHTAQGIIPAPLWLALYLICAVIFVYLLFFADSTERALTQGVLMGSVTVVITLLMLLLGFFDNPHGEGLGRLQPTAMERSLRIVDAQLDVLGLSDAPPCDEQGNAAG